MLEGEKQGEGERNGVWGEGELIETTRRETDKGKERDQFSRSQTDGNELPL